MKEGLPKKVDEIGNCFMCHGVGVPIELEYEGLKVCPRCCGFLLLTSVYGNDVAKEGRRQEAIKSLKDREVG